MKLHLGAVLLATALLAHCKPAHESESVSGVKTLDGLAGTEASPNECHGSEPSLTAWRNTSDAVLAERAKRQIRVPQGAEASVDVVFTAIPKGIVRTVLMLGYEIEFTNDPATACQGVAPGALAAAHGCAKATKVEVDENGQKVAGEKITLYLSAAPGDVAHSTLTGVFTLVSQKLGKIAAGETTLVVKDEDDAAMVTFRHNLAAAVLDDAARRGLKLAPLAHLLPRSPELLARGTPLARRQELWRAFFAASQANAVAAESMIFANTADSYYCTTGANSTRSRFAAWNAAKTVWEDSMVADIEQLATLGDESAAPAEKDAAPSSGFGLWGRWGAGNGPLRQMFANRVDDTGYAFPRLHGLRRGFDGSGDWYSPPAWGDGRLGWRLRGDYEDSANAYQGATGTGLETTAFDFSGSAAE